MADALSGAATLPRTTVYRPVNRTHERIFFSGMAVLLCGAVVFGFWKTYFGAGVIRAPLPNPLWHVHGAVFTLWMVVYTVQTALISAKRVALHRTLGIFAFCLTPVIFTLGMLLALNALRMGVQIGPLDPQTSYAIPALGMMVIGPLFYFAWRARRKPDAHKRLILLATIGMVDAAFGRFPWSKIGLTPAAGAVAALVFLLVLVVGYDLYSLRRLHKATIWAVPPVFLVGTLAVPIGMTHMWHAFADFMAKYVAPHV